MRLLSDSELFVEQATWFAPHLSQPTIGHFACWLAPWLRGSSKHALEALYRLNHPAQRAAEAALIELLEAAPKRAAQRHVLGGQCGRSTDWASTLALAHPFSPVQFLDQRAAAELDVGTLRGLATIARQWAFLLTEYGGYAELHPRVAKLRGAARTFGSGQLTLGHLRTLARSPQLEGNVNTLRKALELMSAPLSTPAARAALANLCENLISVGRAELENHDDALEVSVLLSIARAAHCAGWQIGSAQVSQTRPKPSMRLAQGKLRCAISKGGFAYPAEPKRRTIDALAKLERDALGLASTGRQPDVVISFWNADAPTDVLFCIADAKRNESGDGLAYLKKSISAMAAYMVAFAEPLRAQLSTEGGGFIAPLMPTATLFLRQSARRSNDADQSVRHSAPRTSPKAWLSTSDTSDYAGVEQDRWSSTAMERWFVGLAASAQVHLRVE